VIRIGIDVGGTFTDLVVVDETSGAARHFKLLSTPSDPAAAVADGVAALLQQSGATGEAIADPTAETVLRTGDRLRLFGLPRQIDALLSGSQVLIE